MASLAADITDAQAWSQDHSYSIMARRGYQTRDWRFIQLSDELERALSNILRHGYDIDRNEVAPATAQSIKAQILAWAKHIAGDIPGYSTWDEIYEFTFSALHDPAAVPGEDPTPIGTEKQLHDGHFDIRMMHLYQLEEDAAEREKLKDHAAALATARDRQEILDRIQHRYTADNPMPDDLALLFRKVRYAYKLRECLLGQVGYYNGSLELAAGMAEDFEFNMYLIQMKLRRPDRIHLFKAPKAMALYRTDPGSLLPWNNQFSFSYGFDEFGPGQFPRGGVNFIERRLVETIRQDTAGKKWEKLCALLSWGTSDGGPAAERIRMLDGHFVPAQNGGGYFLAGDLTLEDCGFRMLTLQNIVRLLIENETKRKAFFTLILGLTWSDTPLRPEDNPFAELYHQRAETAVRMGAVIDHDLAHLAPSDVKDPRIADESRAPLLTLKEANRYPQVVGRKANFILAPETAASDFRDKLRRLGEKQLDDLFGNIPAYPRGSSRDRKIDAVVDQAVQAAQAWMASAVENRRPVYTGPSGHMLSYSRISLHDADRCPGGDHPTLEQRRLVLLAALIGVNEHHTYDEGMFASHGLEHGGVVLAYTDRAGYRDIINSADPFVRGVGDALVEAAVNIGREAVRRFDQHAPVLDPPLPDWRETVEEWFEQVIGRPFPGF